LRYRVVHIIADHNDHQHGAKHADDPSACGQECSYERFTRLLSVSVAIVKKKETWSREEEVNDAPTTRGSKG